MKLFYIIKANIRTRKGSFFCIVVLVFLMTAIGISMYSVKKVQENTLDTALDECNTGDLVSVLMENKYNEDMIETVKQNKNIKNVKIIESFLTVATIDGEECSANSFFLDYKENKNLYKLYSEDAQSFVEEVTLNEGEIFIPYICSQVSNCKIGDVLKIDYTDVNGEKTKEFTIKGFVQEPLFGSDSMGCKMFFINDNDFQKLYTDRIVKDNADRKCLTGWKFINIYKKAESTLSTSDLKKEINKESGLVDIAFYTMTKDMVKYYTFMLTSIVTSILEAFCILMYIIVFVVIGYSISSSIEMEYSNIGMLKSQGFSKTKLRLILIIQYVFSEIIGIILGVGVSFIGVKYLNPIYQNITGLLGVCKVDIVYVGILILTILTISIIYMIFKTRKIAKISPVVAIRNGNNDIFFKNRLINTIKKNALMLHLALRQIITGKKNYISTVFTVTLLVFFMLMIQSLRNIISNDFANDMFGYVVSNIAVNDMECAELEDSKTDTDEHEKETKEMLEHQECIKDVENTIKSVTDIKDYYENKLYYFTINDNEYVGEVMSRPELIKSIQRGRPPKYDNEIMFTSFVEEELGKTIGDKVTVKYKEKSREMLITGIYQRTNDAGMTFCMSKTAMQKLYKENIKLTNYYILKDSQKTAEVVKVLKDKFGEEIEVENINEETLVPETVTNSISLVNSVIYVLAIIFILVVVKIVCTKMFYKEKKDFGIYKAMGFTSKKLRGQFVLRFLIVTLVSSVLGFVLNVLLNNKVMQVLLSSLGISEYKTVYTLTSVIIPILFVNIIFVVMSYIQSRKIKRVDTRTLIVE